MHSQSVGDMQEVRPRLARSHVAVSSARGAAPVNPERARQTDVAIAMCVQRCIIMRLPHFMAAEAV